MAQWVKGLATSAGNLGSDHKIRMVEVETWLLKEVSDFSTYAEVCAYLCVCVHTHTERKQFNFYEKKTFRTPPPLLCFLWLLLFQAASSALRLYQLLASLSW